MFLLAGKFWRREREEGGHWRAMFGNEGGRERAFYCNFQERGKGGEGTAAIFGLEVTKLKLLSWICMVFLPFCQSSDKNLIVYLTVGVVINESNVRIHLKPVI